MRMPCHVMMARKAMVKMDASTRQIFSFMPEIRDVIVSIAMCPPLWATSGSDKKTIQTKR